MKNNQGLQEKKTVALRSVFAAVFLTAIKIIVGMTTGSLGILSEALHSGLDLIAALMTYFAVKIADKPADSDHNYGHGKVENLSALFETVLLVITCFWIVQEAIYRLLSGKTEIKVTIWSFIVVIASIIIDAGRSIALKRVAKKYNSQALEADALHFSTDILSSLVVLIGLIGALTGYFIADSISALFVAVIVLSVCFRLGKKSIDVLLDKSREDLILIVSNIIKGIPDIRTYHDLKIRTSGADTFVDLSIHLHPNSTLEFAHHISDELESRIRSQISRCEVHVHAEPDLDI
ncbi:MAG: cation diffusion facilitator family transporter [Candidatus Kapabacteria bacterium]|nr:cation diffusion facilitator family transporter [Candidatus Kapabacteria bacterium]